MTPEPDATDRVRPVVEVAGLSKTFGGGTPVLSDVDLVLEHGTVSVVTGSNGAGKSTLLECLAGAQPYDRGTMRLHGRPVSPQTREHWLEVHAVLDDFAWFPDLSVMDHFAMLDPDADRERVVSALRRLGAEALLDRRPLTLSSGQRQRCALATAAVRPWTLLLLDEPERHLDATTVPAVLAFVQDLADRGAVLMASHAPELAEAPGIRRFHVHAGTLAGAT